jgi:fructoselysine 6-kinase
LDQLQLTATAQQFISTYDIAATQWQGAGSDALLAQFLQLPRQVKRVVDFGDWQAGGTFPLPTTLNALDLAFFSGDHTTVGFLEPLARQTDCLIVVTLGAGGSVALTAPHPHFQPALQVDPVVDSTGCGDAFQAAFTTSYFCDGDIPAALVCGAQQAAQVLQHFGSFRQEPRPIDA